MSDRIFIDGLIVTAIIGIDPDERTTPQPIRFDVELATDALRAARTERIEDAIDYVRACDIIRDTAIHGKFLLVETLAERIALRLRDELAVKWLRLRIGKPNAIADASLVGVEIERGTRQS